MSHLTSMFWSAPQLYSSSNNFIITDIFLFSVSLQNDITVIIDSFSKLALLLTY